MINDDYVSFSALKYPKIIYVKCLDTGKVYKAEKIVVCKLITISSVHHYKFRNNILYILYNVLYNSNGFTFYEIPYEKGMFLCNNYPEDIDYNSIDAYKYFSIISKSNDDLKVKKYIKDNFVYKTGFHYPDTLDNTYKHPLYFDYNFIRVTKKEYDEYLNSRN